jgi:superfamily II DNA or RNA helicase
VASTIMDEGIDVKALDTLILAGAGKSKTRALQRVGRVLRPYTSPSGDVKTEAIVVDIQDNCKYMREHAKKREKMYRTEPAFNIEKMDQIG